MLSRADGDGRCYRREGRRSEPYGAFLALEADELPELVFACLRELRDAPTFFDHALSLINEAAFAAAITRAVPAVTDGDAPAVAVIDYASLQVPQLLAPHLAALWEPTGETTSWHSGRGAVLTVRSASGYWPSSKRAETRRFSPDERVGGQRAALALLEFFRDESTVRGGPRRRRGRRHSRRR